MKNKHLMIGYACFVLLGIAAFITFTITGHEKYQRFAFGASGPGIGLIIGYLLRNKDLIIDKRKFKTDLIVLLCIAVIGSLFMWAFLDLGDLLSEGIIFFNATLMAVLALRNSQNIQIVKE